MDPIPEPLLAFARGLLALNLFALLFYAARYRWRERESDRGAPDIGLD